MTEPKEWTVWLPFPVSTNNLFSHGMVKGKVRRFPSGQYKSWRREAVLRLIEAKANGQLPRTRYQEPVVIKLALTPRDGRRRDASNYIKAVEDALVDARVLAGDDQRWVKSAIAYWEEPNVRCGVVVTLRIAALPLWKATETISA